VRPPGGTGAGVRAPAKVMLMWPLELKEAAAGQGQRLAGAAGCWRHGDDHRGTARSGRGRRGRSLVRGAVVAGTGRSSGRP